MKFKVSPNRRQVKAPCHRKQIFGPILILLTITIPTVIVSQECGKKRAQAVLRLTTGLTKKLYPDQKKAKDIFIKMDELVKNAANEDIDAATNYLGETLKDLQIQAVTTSLKKCYSELPIDYIDLEQKKAECCPNCSISDEQVCSIKPETHHNNCTSIYQQRNRTIDQYTSRITSGIGSEYNINEIRDVVFAYLNSLEHEFCKSMRNCDFCQCTTKSSDTSDTDIHNSQPVNDDHLPVWVIVFIVVLVIFVAVLLIAVVAMYLRNRKFKKEFKTKKTDEAKPQEEDELATSYRNGNGRFDAQYGEVQT